MKTKDFYVAVTTLYPNVDRIVGEKAYDLNGDEVTYDRAALEAFVVANQYKDQRAVAYPSIQEQLDLLYWDKINDTDNWEQAIAAVKAEYPKG